MSLLFSVDTSCSGQLMLLLVLLPLLLRSTSLQPLGVSKEDMVVVVCFSLTDDCGGAFSV